jgi:hypothetical protein
MLVAIAGLALPLSAHADIMGGSFDGSASGAASSSSRGGFGGGFDARGGYPSVVGNDTAAFGLKMYGSLGSVVHINSGGNVSRVRSVAPASIGENRNGQLNNGSRGEVLAAWDEFIGATTNTVRAIIKTSDGQEIMPFGVTSGNESFNFWTWNFGVGDAVTFREGVPSAAIFAATYSFSRDGGLTFFTTRNMLPNLDNPWPGTDDGTLQIEVGSGVNYILLSYQIAQVPAPGALALGGLAVLGAARRRR